jgi:hypothetical protein
MNAGWVCLFLDLRLEPRPGELPVAL